MQTDYNPFRLKLHRALAVPLERLLGLHILARLYDRRPDTGAMSAGDRVDTFLDYTLAGLGAQMKINNADALQAIPTDGPLIFVSNHPLGGIEGVFMTRMLRHVRPDLKVLTNELLSLIPEFSGTFVGVDVLSEDAAHKNGRGVREVIRHLKKGGAVLIYPAGQVSALRLGSTQIADRPWNAMVGRLAAQFEAKCVPFHVRGRNSWLFYLSGLVHPRLRTAMLPREMIRGSRLPASITVGNPILWSEARKLGDAGSITRYLRTAMELLEHQPLSCEPEEPRYPALALKSADSADYAQRELELKALGEFELLQSGEFTVYCAPHARLGSIMQNIALARERTFRAAGEGTGLEEDSDRYDGHYLHLFIHDNEQQAIVGGYRLGIVDEILAERGVEGLYSRSLYEFDESYIARFGQCVEMGRSFIAPEYQRHPRALDLLWRGIGTWVVQHPGYHTLFGCVSISAEHSYLARSFLKESLMSSFRAEQEYLSGVKPVAPLRVRKRVWSEDMLASLSDVALINKLLGQCDPGKSVPVLLRKYLALNGRFIGFTVNHGFNQSLDGLILVDLRKTPPKYLQRYLGKTGSEQFLQRWSVNRVSA